MADITKRFIDALGQLEQTGDEGPIAALFGEGATVENPLVADSEVDPDAASFWRSYRKTFDEIRSDFRNVVEGDGVSILEWSSDGTRKGEAVRYGGTSVIEHDGEAIVAFRSYFDPTKVGVV